MAEYTETDLDSTDVENVVLEALAGGNPFAFLVTRIDRETGDLDMRIATGGGIPDVRTLRNMLEKALRAIPEEV